MKTIGLIGGMSWESTSLYYQVVNREVARRRGGLHSARMHIVSLDFDDIATRQRANDWVGMARILLRAARQLEEGGAGCILIGTNTMHKLATEVQAGVSVPLLHIADVTAHAIRGQGLRSVGLLGTRFTMEEPFYAERLARHGVSCVVPGEAERAEVHRIIFEELCRGRCLESSRQTLREICQALAAQGAQGVVLGCTELPLMLRASDVAVPLFDTTTLHAVAAVDFALMEEDATNAALTA